MERLGIDDIISGAANRLRQYVHVLRKDDNVSVRLHRV